MKSLLSESSALKYLMIKINSGNMKIYLLYFQYFIGSENSGYQDQSVIGIRSRSKFKKVLFNRMNKCREAMDYMKTSVKNIH